MNTEKRIYYLYDNTSSAHSCNTEIKSNWRKMAKRIREKGRRFFGPLTWSGSNIFIKSTHQAIKSSSGKNNILISTPLDKTANSYFIQYYFKIFLEIFFTFDLEEGKQQIWIIFIWYICRHLDKCSVVKLNWPNLGIAVMVETSPFSTWKMF